MVRIILKTVATQLALMPIGLTVGILTARYLGASDRGLLTLLLLLPSTAATLANVGLDSAAIYFHNRQKIDLERVFGNSVSYALIGGTIVAIGIWIGRHYLSAVFQDITPTTLALAISIIPLRLLNNALGALLRAKHDFAAYNRRTLLEGVLTAVGIGVALFVFGGSLQACLAVYPAVLAVICGWMLVDVSRYLTRLPRPDLSLAGPMWRYGMKSYASMLANHLHMRVDVYLVAVYLTNKEIAFYSIGAKLAERILMVPTVASTVLFPRLSAATSTSGAALTALLCRTTLFVSGATAILILLVGRAAIKLLYGEEYLPAAGPMYVIIFGVGAVGLMRQLANYLKSVDQHQYSIYAVGAGAAVNVGLNVVLIPRYGIMGAAVSSLLSYTLQAVAMLIVFRRLTGVPWRQILIMTRQDVKNARRSLTRPSSALKAEHGEIAAPAVKTSQG